MNKDCLLKAQNITCRYSSHFQLQGINLQLRCGDVLGLLGPNGAGKSSLLTLLSGRQTAHQGLLSIRGQTLTPGNFSLRRHIGFLSDPPPLYPDLTVSEFLDYALRLYGFKKHQKSQKVKSIIQRCDLESRQHQVIKTLSKGFKQRVALAQVIAHQPQIILLDEPGDGLDPVQQTLLHKLIKELRQTAALVLATHNYQDVENCCNQVLILNQGRTLYQGDFKQLTQSLHNTAVVARFGNPPPRNKLELINGVDQVKEYDQHRFVLTAKNCQTLTPALMQASLHAGWQLEEIHPYQNSLDTIFEQLLGDCR